VLAPVKLFLATSNRGKLREYRALLEIFSGPRKIEIDPLPEIARLPPFPEDAPTFAENAVGKALHYSSFTDELVFADDSGLVVPELGGSPGVLSARYAGKNASDADRIRKLLEELADKQGSARRAYFVCVIAATRKGRALAVVSGRVDGEILEAPRGTRGFGYDPIFFLPQLGKTFAEQSLAEKNLLSHRSQAFRRLYDFLSDTAK
jgi:XTP/dITP diphosphohydrolase